MWRHISRAQCLLAEGNRISVIALTCFSLFSLFEQDFIERFIYRIARLSLFFKHCSFHSNGTSLNSYLTRVKWGQTRTAWLPSLLPPLASHTPLVNDLGNRSCPSFYEPGYSFATREALRVVNVLFFRAFIDWELQMSRRC